MNDRLLIRVAAMSRASDVPQDHGANKWRLECLRMTVGFWGVRYQVKDVQRAITFYVQTLGFNLDMAVNRSPADGTVFFFRCRICLRALLT
jgi:hypothetical protein